MSRIPALVVRQWLSPEWDQTKFEPVPPRGKPEPHFYIFSINAYLLKKLTGIYRRDPNKPPAEDMGIQRRHIPERSEEILRYIHDGFPLSRIDRKKLVDPAEAKQLQMPGWLPTAVVVNILTETDRIGPKKSKVAADDLVKVHYRERNSAAEIELPKECEKADWQPTIHPIEVIDGQHRLWALEEPEEDEAQWPAGFKERLEQIEIPVVAFHGLDRTWQAYLFYTINQLAKRIDISMVFDLYPLLRTEDWLLRFEGPNIYRETRAQDLTILLWGHPQSPWKDRIIRLGGREKGKVAQSAFIRSLTASFIKRWQGWRRNPIGGVFGAMPGTHETLLGWGREQQAAFLIMVWRELRQKIVESEATWTKTLLKPGPKAGELPIAENPELLFSGPDTLLASDQGVRGYMCVVNDMLWVGHDKEIVTLDQWDWNRKPKQNDEQAISDALASLHRNLPEVVKFVQKICVVLSTFDWRISSALKPTDPQYSRQASYRGSSGYREIRRNMLTHLRSNLKHDLQKCVDEVIDALKYDVEEEA
ncbi:MAG TPA: DGQHR domain-containing protein [Verrucomicrobiae bacterium]|nr:DGQHR domain-containing protein [Verrucomicrobiae bacterium]